MGHPNWLINPGQQHAPETGLRACGFSLTLGLPFISVSGSVWFSPLCTDVAGHVSYSGSWFSSPPALLQVHSLKLALEGVEKERDFYFGKLREIELLCQEHGQENDDLVQRLMEVLYASDEQVGVRSCPPRVLKRRLFKVQHGRAFKYFPGVLVRLRLSLLAASMVSEK